MTVTDACLLSLNGRCPLKTLQKCEIALEKLKNDMAVVGLSSSSTESSDSSVLPVDSFFLMQEGLAGVKRRVVTRVLLESALCRTFYDQPVLRDCTPLALVTVH